MAKNVIYGLEEVLREEDLDDREDHWIRYYREINPRLTNVSQECLGKNRIGKPFTEQHRRRLSVAMSRRWADPEVRRKMSSLLKGRVFSQESLQRMKQGQRRRREREIKVFEDTGVRLSPCPPSPKGRHHTEETRLLLARIRGARPFVDQFGTRYESVRSTARLLGLDSSSISKALKGKIRQVGGYVFSYE
jgi:hypothetical protein